MTNTLEHAHPSKESLVVDKVDAANLTCTKGCKQRLLEDENFDTLSLTCKKSKVSVCMRILIFTYRINAFKRRKQTFT